MAKHGWVEDTLRAGHADFDVRPHGAIYRSMDLVNAEQYSSGRVAKVVVSITEEGPALLVLPANRFVDLTKAKRAMAVGRVRLARESEIAKRFPDAEVGATPPLDHWGHVPIYVDESGFLKDQLVFPAGSHEESIVVNYKDWLAVARPVKAAFSTASKPRQKRLSLARMSLWILLLGAILVAVFSFAQIISSVGGTVSWTQLVANGFSSISMLALAPGFLSLALSVMAGVLVLAVAFLALGEWVGW